MPRHRLSGSSCPSDTSQTSCSLPQIQHPDKAYSLALQESRHQDISFFQPPKEVATDTFLLYLELSYPAQKSFAIHNWSIKLLGTNIRLNKHNAPKGTSPEIRKVNSPRELLESTDNLELTQKTLMPSEATSTRLQLTIGTHRRLARGMVHL